MAAPTNTPLPEDIWHLNIEDLFAPLPEKSRLGGPGPFVITLSASFAPIHSPAKNIAGAQHIHVYQRIEDGRPRYRLRLGPFATEDDADAVLPKVRDIYPSALTATADADDLRTIAALRPRSSPPPSAAKAAVKPAANAAASMFIDQTARPVANAAVSTSVEPTPKSAAPVEAAAKPMVPAPLEVAVNPVAPVPGEATVKQVVPSLVEATVKPVVPTLVEAVAKPVVPVPVEAMVKPVVPTLVDVVHRPVDTSVVKSAVSLLGVAPPLTARPPLTTAPASTALPLVAAAPSLPAAAKAVAPKPMNPAAAAPIAPRPLVPPPKAPVRAPVPLQAESPSKLMLSIESTQTVRALTQLELEDDQVSRWFSIQLSLAEESFDPETLPNLDIFSVYRLYSVAGIDQGRIVHALRLGFFTDQIAAGAVASYLAAFYDKPSVKRVSSAERERFAEQSLEARKDVGTTGKQAVIEITNERYIREKRIGQAAAK
jgi:hypothetical protein